MSDQISVVVCTYNRSADVAECVDSVRRQTAGKSEILIVDSASAPEHAGVLREYASHFADVAYIREDTSGLSVARNLAARVSNCSWLAFLDDDARPADGWWAAAERAVKAAEATTCVIGGRILPGWPTAVAPTYVGRRWLMFLSCVEDSDQDSAEVPTCFGANLLVRRDDLIAVGGFSPVLGRQGNLLLSGEESHLQHRLIAAGRQIKYEGEMTVIHEIGRERLSRDWIARRAYWGGVTAVVDARTRQVAAPHLNPAKALISTMLLRLRSLADDDGSDAFIRSQYAKGVLAAQWGSLRRRLPGSVAISPVEP